MFGALALCCWVVAIDAPVAKDAAVEAVAAAEGQAAPQAFTLLAGVEIPEPVLPRLQALAAAFLAATGKPLTITDGTRRPETQAALMLRNLDRGDDIVRNYANRTAAAQVRAAWVAARKAGLDPAATLAAIHGVIAAQVAAGDYVSKHLRAGAVDVRSSDMARAERATFKRLARELGIAVVDESRTATPHFHLNFV